jgi:hypothetical protein
MRYAAPAVACVAIPNGGKRGPLAARRAKAEGMASGFPDVICLWDGGLCLIEFKAAKGKLSANQAGWIERLDRWGHRVAVCRTIDEAIAFIRACGAPMLA